MSSYRRSSWQDTTPHTYPSSGDTHDLSHKSNPNNLSINSKKKHGLKKTSNIPHHKAGRVKVGIRCRPPFQEEIRKSKDTFVPIISTKNDPNDSLGKVVLTLPTSKQREFHFDYVFGPSSSQDAVYDRVARPVVSDVLNGFNGTIFAYGQTGTGKTYTMGILEAVADENAGLIPRAISGIFRHVQRHRHVDIKVTMSFLQIYRENIQDLLSSAAVGGEGGAVGFVDDNLPIREDPTRGFYVEGLQEYIVHCYEEAEALLNLGLESRAIASTLMNSTSSRSHTVLTISIDQRGDIPLDGEEEGVDGGPVLRRRATGGARILHSKLLMVDLAGSERVRKTISRGTRLDEAKSINTSLSALGNVIAALAESNSAHVPYRDSKLTRILHDSLGGTASTSLIATVGPAPSNYNETLSTLQFASRCMAVKSTPVQHEELDFADMCTRLQQQLSTVEGKMAKKLNEQQEKYEATIRQLREQLKAGRGHNTGPVRLPPQSSSALNSILSFLESGGGGDSWLTLGPSGGPCGEQSSVLLAFCFDTLRSLLDATVDGIKSASERAKLHKKQLQDRYREENERERAKRRESDAMMREDPMRKLKEFKSIGSHLEPLSGADALSRVEENFLTEGMDEDILSSAVLVDTHIIRQSITDYSDAGDLARALDYMSNGISINLKLIADSLERKDGTFRGLKDELVKQMVEKRSREEEVVNWSYILKYLLATSSKLRGELARQKNLYNRDISNGETLGESRRERGNEHDQELLSAPELPRRPERSTSLPSAVDLLESRRRPQAKDDKLSDGSPVGSPLSSRKPQPETGGSRPYVSPSASQQLQRVQYRMRSAISAEKEERRRQNHAGKLGPRLSSAYPAVRHNAFEIDQIGPPPDDDEILSLSESEADGSFRSAATVGSIPPHVSRSVKHSAFAKDVVHGLGVQGDQAVAAMSVIDRVSSMSDEQLRRVDPETRAQIMSIRSELGLTGKSSGGNASPLRASPMPDPYHDRYFGGDVHPPRRSQSNGAMNNRYISPLVNPRAGGMYSASSSYQRTPQIDDYDDDTYSQIDSESDWN